MFPRYRARALPSTRRGWFNLRTHDIAATELAVVAGARRLVVVFHQGRSTNRCPVAECRHLSFVSVCEPLFIRANRRNAPCRVRDFGSCGSLATTAYCFVPSPARSTKCEHVDAIVRVILFCIVARPFSYAERPVQRTPSRFSRSVNIRAFVHVVIDPAGIVELRAFVVVRYQCINIQRTTTTLAAIRSYARFICV